jgi:hypothetical protein
MGHYRDQSAGIAAMNRGLALLVQAVPTASR